MLTDRVRDFLKDEIAAIRAAELYKEERVIATPQQASIGLVGGTEVLNMCANDYLGLANHPEVVEAARGSYDQWGYGLSSVRFICGTQEIHRQLEESVHDVMAAQLSPREQRVLHLRFGLDGGQARTLKQVAEIFGVTRERVRQIEARALRRLRHASVRHKALREAWV